MAVGAESDSAQLVDNDLLVLPEDLLVRAAVLAAARRRPLDAIQCYLETFCGRILAETWITPASCPPRTPGTDAI